MKNKRSRDIIDCFRLGLEQKNVIIQRDRYGYGLTVSGDNPVYVLSVREGGAAHRAGININDQIIKVEEFYSNETNVKFDKIDRDFRNNVPMMKRRVRVKFYIEW